MLRDNVGLTLDTLVINANFKSLSVSDFNALDFLNKQKNYQKGAAEFKKDNKVSIWIDSVSSDGNLNIQSSRDLEVPQPIKDYLESRKVR